MQVSCNRQLRCDRAVPEGLLVGEPEGRVVDEISYCDDCAPGCNAENGFDDASAGKPHGEGRVRPGGKSRFGCTTPSDGSLRSHSLGLASAHGIVDALRRQTSWNQLTDDSLGRLSSVAEEDGMGWARQRASRGAFGC